MKVFKKIQRYNAERKMLFEPPFTDVHDQGIYGVFDDATASNVVKLIDQVNGNAIIDKASVG